MFLPRCTTRSLLPAVAGGLVLSIIWSWWEVIFQTKSRPTFLLSIAVPCLTTFGIAAFLGFILNRKHDGRQAEYTWWAIMRRPEPKEIVE
jgi:hypothetical protein